MPLAFPTPDQVRTGNLTGARRESRQVLSERGNPIRKNPAIEVAAQAMGRGGGTNDDRG